MTPTSGVAAVAARLSTLWFAKMSGTTLGMSGFFVAYFWLLQHPLYPVTVMPLIWPDRIIGFRPEALLLYVTLWAYVALPPALLADRRELLSYGYAALALALAGLGIFLFWPTAVPHFAIDWSRYGPLGLLKQTDLGGNACPSLHVAFAVFSAIWLERLLRQMAFGVLVRACNWLWCLGIVYSTIAIRQHVALDVLAGTALGAGAAALHLAALRRRQAGQGAPAQPATEIRRESA
jgi:membrane-associated phospholipid phosphatase